jgi:ADP-ribosylglycohydrolase
VQPADRTEVRRAERLSRVRGLLLGLALGDALTRPEQPGSGPLLGTTTTQLACFTAEGLIRAMVRADHRRLGPAPEALFLAYRRWACGQGIPLPRPAQPSGWLHRVPALAERRGDAPAVVAALQAAHDPAPGPAPVTSHGHHALSPRLPLAAVAAPADWIREVVLATHGNPDAVRAAVAGVELARAVLGSGSVHEALRATPEPLLDEVRAGYEAGCPAASRAVLAPDHSAVSALRGGAALAAVCPGPDAIAQTLASARELPVPGAVGPVAGALLGAAHGAEALPVELVARLELGWAVDTLARDLVAQVEDRPGGSEYQQPADRHWWPRYPGG